MGTNVDVNTIVDTVTQDLNTKLSGVLTSNQLVAIFKKTISDAYEQVPAEHGRLFRLLSLEFHPDKLIRSTHPFAIYLKTRRSDQTIPQQTLNKINQALTTITITEAMNSPTFFVTKISEFLFRTWNMLDEYPYSLALLTQTVVIVLGVVSFVAMLAVVFIPFLFELPQKWLHALVNWITTDTSDQWAKVYPEDYLSAKKEYAKKCRKDLLDSEIKKRKRAGDLMDETDVESFKIELASKEDDTILELMRDDMLPTQPDYSTENEIKSVFLAEGFNRLTVTASGLLNAILKPFSSEDTLGKIGEFVKRAFLAIAAAIIIPVMAVHAAVARLIVTPLFAVVLPIVLVIAPVACIAIIAAPVYFKDRLNQWRNSAEVASEPTEENNTNAATAEQQSAAVAPIHHVRLFPVAAANDDSAATAGNASRLGNTLADID